MKLAPVLQRADAPVLGYRVFRLRRGGKLTSAAFGDEWTAELHEATCQQHNHAAPQLGCDCGIHAFGALSTAERYSGRRWLKWPGLTTGTVLGAVLLYSGGGRPLVAGELSRRSGVRSGRGQLQYRAPYGRLIALVDGPGAREAGARLGLPVLPKRDQAGRPAFERYAREHGTELETAPEPVSKTAPRSESETAPRPAGLVGLAARTHGALNVCLVLLVAVLCALSVASDLTWAVIGPALRVAWWLAWWGLRIGGVVLLVCLVFALSIIGIEVAGRRS